MTGWNCTPNGRAVSTSKTPIEKFQQAVDKALQDYADGTLVTVKDLTKRFAQKGAQAVKNASAQAYGSGRYSGSWTYTMEETRLGSTGIIHSKVPGLPHLLEHGHANRHGGRTYPPVPGREHIAPVEESISEEFLKAVENDL